MPSKYKKKDLSGLRFGRLVVIGKQSEDGQHGTHWLCRCDCGTEKAFPSSILNNGHVTDCGCICESEEYTTWKAMKRRCYRVSDNSYHNYGARGITVCDRWRDSFDNFLADMGPKPSHDHSIDRIDNDGNYEPGNCKWASRSEQSANRRPNHRIEYNGQTLSAAALARELGTTKSTIINRIHHGLDLTAPIADQSGEYGLIEFDGKSLPMRQWAILCGFDHSTIRKRLKKGWSVANTLTTPSRKISGSGYHLS